MEKTCRNIDQYLGGTRNSEAWKVIKATKTNRKETSKITCIKDQEWENHYRTLLTEKRKEFTNNGEQIIERTEEEQIEIPLEEVRKAAKSMKNNKSAGPGGIAPEFIKYGTEMLYRMLQQMFEKVLNGNDVPGEWKEANLTSIFKKGEINKCDNYRGISVIATLGRLYARIIRNKLEENIQGKIGEEQACFTAGKSCTDQIYTVQQFLQKKKAKNKEIHLAFIDLKQAYDSVPRSGLWKAMNHLNLPSKLITAVQTIYKGNTVHVKIGNQIITSFETSKGLLQGCPTSPTLFKIFLENTLKNWKQKCQGMGVPIRDEYLYTLCFADGQIVIAQDEEDLSYMVRKLRDEYTKAELEINLKKTEYLTTEEEVKNLEIEDNLEIRGTDKYKYLGCVIAKDTTTDKEIQNRLAQTRTAIRQLHRILWNKDIGKKTKKMIYASIIQSIMTYSEELWIINKKHQGKILATEMEYCRRCCCLTRMDRIPNEEIRRRMEVKEDVMKYIETKRLLWYGHVKRTENRWISKVTDWSPIGRRKKCRPKRSWRNEVDESMQRRGLDEGDWEQRDQWRTWLKEGRQRQL